MSSTLNIMLLSLLKTQLRRCLPVVVIGFLATGCDAGTSHDPGGGSAVTGEYRNFFVEAGYTPEDVDRKIEDAFNQLFHGDPDDEAIYYPAGENEHGALGYIYDVNSEDVRSEGLSYGMMIALQMDEQEIFDAIWNWALTHTYHDDPAHPAYGYFAWSVQTDGTSIDEMPAPDGEEYFVTALYFASARWGEGDGIYEYSSWADRIVTDILHREEITGMTNRGEMTAINLFDTDALMVRFTPDVENAYHTDPSYHLPAFYEVWARVGPEEDRAFWREAARVSRDYFYNVAHPETGLTPDYANFDATPWAAPWRPESADFRYDAWRTAMNWSMDWVWWAEDRRQIELSNRLLSFFHEQGIDEYVSLYTLDGRPLDDGQTAALVSMNATAAMSATIPEAEDFIHALWNRPLDTGRYRYYDGALQMMALLHLSGKYRVWGYER